MENIEQQLKGLPKFQAESMFKDKLKQRVLKENSHQGSWRFLTQFGLLLGVVVVFFVGTRFATQNSSPSIDTFDAPATIQVPESKSEQFSENEDVVQKEATASATLTPSPNNLVP